jgi:hypothetical protein
MNRAAAIDLLDRLHEAQNEFYAGGSGAALEQLLAPNIAWAVTGDNCIAGTYRGLEEAFGYFRRRDFAGHSFQMKRRVFSSATDTELPRLPTGSRRSVVSTIAGAPWACTTSAASRSRPVGCFILTNAR